MRRRRRIAGHDQGAPYIADIEGPGHDADQRNVPAILARARKALGIGIGHWLTSSAQRHRPAASTSEIPLIVLQAPLLTRPLLHGSRQCFCRDESRCNLRRQSAEARGACHRYSECRPLIRYANGATTVQPIAYPRFFPTGQHDPGHGRFRVRRVAIKAMHVVAHLLEHPIRWSHAFARFLYSHHDAALRSKLQLDILSNLNHVRHPAIGSLRDRRIYHSDQRKTGRAN